MRVRDFTVSSGVDPTRLPGIKFQALSGACVASWWAPAGVLGGLVAVEVAKTLMAVGDRIVNALMRQLSQGECSGRWRLVCGSLGTQGRSASLLWYHNYCLSLVVSRNL